MLPLLADCILAVETQGFVNPRQFPPLLESAGGPEGKTLDFGIAAGTSELLAGVSTPTLGINGAYLGPTIRCRPPIE